MLILNNGFFQTGYMFGKGVYFAGWAYTFDLILCDLLYTFLARHGN